VLDGVRVVRVGLLEDSLEVVCRRPRVALDAASGGHNSLDARAVCLLAVVVIAAACCGSDRLRALLPPLLAALDILHGALDGNVGWHRLAVVGDHFLVT
jgi:hypothetical protein